MTEKMQPMSSRWKYRARSARLGSRWNRPVLPPLLIRQKLDRHKDFPTPSAAGLRRRIAKVVTFAAFVETRVVLEIVVCKSLLQKVIPSQRLLPRSGAML